MGPIQAEKARRLRIREAAMRNYSAPMQGLGLRNKLFFNTHHLVYQFYDERGAFHQINADMVEMNEAQFERWLTTLRAARQASRLLPGAVVMP